MFAFIYKITNTINNKVYIGQTWQPLKQRFRKHLSNKHKFCRKLFHAFNKHGRENFNVEPILIAHTQIILDHWEKYFIKKYDSIKNGYNIQEGGAYGRHSEETKKLLSKIMKGKRNSPATEFKPGHVSKFQFKKGNIPWSKGKKTGRVPPNKTPDNIRTKILNDTRTTKIVADTYGVSRKTVQRIRNANSHSQSDN